MFKWFMQAIIISHFRRGRCWKYFDLQRKRMYQTRRQGTCTAQHTSRRICLLADIQIQIGARSRNAFIEWPNLPGT
uniref:Putative secreted peptide n=1 Tax=Anopheles braziliensis TaxID=58242 RepID=A0A2M3ZPE1_9DIPT